MANDIFLKLAGIPGEATDPTYLNWIDVLAWSWGESNAAAHDCAAATVIKTAELVDRNGANLVFSKYALTNVIVTSVQTSGSAGGGGLTESISLRYDTIKWTYTYVNSLNQPVSKTQGWDVVNGVPL